MWDRYSSKFPGGLALGQVHMRSTNYNRTRLSAAAVLTGMMGRQGGGSDGATYTVEVQPRDTDPLHGLPCPRAAQLRAEQQGDRSAASPVVRDLAVVVDYVVCAHCDSPGSSLSTVLDGMNMTEARGRLADFLQKDFCPPFWGEKGLEASKMSMQPLLREMACTLADETASGPRLSVLVAHDTVLAPLVSALGAAAGCFLPPFASRVAFESWAAPGGGGAARLVRVLVNGADVTSRIQGCGGQDMCPVGQLSATVESLAAAGACDS